MPITSRRLLNDIVTFGDAEDRAVAEAILAGRRYHPEYKGPGCHGRREVQGRVYYALRSKDSRIKIGFSTRMERRWREVRWHDRREGGWGLRLLATEPGTWRTEQARHRQFRPWWIEGEWFEQCAAILAHVGSLA